MPTSLGIMHILAGPPPPPPPPPPRDGCWPTPHEAATTASTASRAVETTFSFRVEPNTLPPPSGTLFCNDNIPSPSVHPLLLALAEKFVQEHGHEEQDAEDKELPGARHAGQDQAVSQRR